MQQATKKVLILLVLAAAVVAVAYLLAGGTNTPGQNSQATTEPKFDYVDLSKATKQEDKVPSGMPSDIPLELANVIESYTMTRDDKAAVQYTLSYKSSKTKAQKYAEYLDFMTKSDYAFGTSGKNEATGTLSGEKNNDALTVVVSNQGEYTLVQLSYLDRK